MKNGELVPVKTEIINNLRQAIICGKHWYIALLEAIGQWMEPEEIIDGRVYRYLIDGEAFDWLLLAERLGKEVEDLLPGDEWEQLLFHGTPPVELTIDEFKNLVGSIKYKQHLNYFYGITVEEALIQAVHEEIRKEKWISGLCCGQDISDMVYGRIYGEIHSVLLKEFRQQKRYPQLRSISLMELKEFIYWLFKYRLERCDKARVASDTKKGLEQLKTGHFFVDGRN